MKKKTRKIAVAKIHHVWKKADADDCGEGPKTVEISPDWYQYNGTPICGCGDDMEYSHTEIDVDEEAIACIKALSGAVKSCADRGHIQADVAAALLKQAKKVTKNL